jgi:hypothetical protein
VTGADSRLAINSIADGVVAATAPLGPDLEAAFVYGSVARGAATTASDIDTFLITRNEPPVLLRKKLDDAFIRLNTEFGYRSDPGYPVEIFSVGTCEHALAGPLVLRAIDTAAREGTLDRQTHDSDDLEILRALLDQRILVINSPILESLTAIARQRLSTAARRHGVLEADLLPRIGLTTVATAR